MLKPGEILDGKYRITRQIGEGGMGAVYLGENTRVRKQVAIKVLHKGGGGVADAVERFEREAQAAGQIGSDHIVEVYDLGTTPDGERFMVMEYLDGESLRDRIKKGSIVQPTAIIPMVLQLLDGLAAAHAAEIVHRDLKPDNIFILREKAGRADFVKILDFGISKFLNVTEGGGAVTRTGMVMGSPNYMSPEQVKSSNDVDGRSDLYTVGVILFEAVTGHVPFKAPTFTELLFKIVYEPLPHPCSINPNLDPAFAEILVRACAQNRVDRYQSARDFSTALLAYLGYVPSPATNAGVPSVKQTSLGVGDTVSQGVSPAAGFGGARAAAPVAKLPPPSAPARHAAPPSAQRSATPSVPRGPAKIVPLADLTFDEPSVAPSGPSVRAAPSPVLGAPPAPASSPKRPALESVPEDDGARTVALDLPTPGLSAPGLSAPGLPAPGPSAPLPAFGPPPNSVGSSALGASGSFAFGPPPSRPAAHTAAMAAYPPPSGPMHAFVDEQSTSSPGFSLGASAAPFAPASQPMNANTTGPFANANQSGGFANTTGPHAPSNQGPAGALNANQSGGFANANQSGGFSTGDQSGGFANANQSGGFPPNTFGATVQTATPSTAPRRSSNKLIAFVGGLAVVAGGAVGTIVYLQSSSTPESRAAAPAASSASAPASNRVGTEPAPPAASAAGPGSAPPPTTASVPASAAPSPSASASARATPTTVIGPKIPLPPKPDDKLGY